METPRKRNTLSPDAKYKLVMAIDERTKPKFEIAKDFEIIACTLTMIYKQRSAIFEAFESEDFSLKRKRMRSEIMMRFKIVTKRNLQNFRI